MLIGALVWLAVAFASGVAGLSQDLRPPIPQIVLIGLTVTLLALFWSQTPVRRVALAVDVRALVLIHVTRIAAGAYFLVLYYGSGALPWAFAVPGGWGDIAVGVTALLVCLVRDPEGESGRRLVLAWNVFGLLDILMVVATATRLALAEPNSMNAILRLPLWLLPAFLVPIIIATHVMIFARPRRR